MVASPGADNMASAASSASAGPDASGRTAAPDRDTPSVRIAQAQPAPAPAPVPLAATPPAAERASAASAEIALPKKPMVGKTSGDFAVQIGIFAQPANAENALTKTKAAGLQTYVETVKAGADAHQRVRVGPFATQAQAKNGAEKVRALGLPAVVVKLQPAGPGATPE